MNHRGSVNRIVMWLDSPSIHQAPLVTSLASAWPGEVVVATTEPNVSSRRVRSGWSRPDFTPATAIAAPSRSERIDLIESGNGVDTVHIFSGLHAYPENYWTLGKACETSAQVGIYVERPANDRLGKGLARRLYYRLQAARWANRLDFILATGTTGVDWYSARGFGSERIYPFGYFTRQLERHADEVRMPPRSGTEVELLFVGQLIPRKGLDLLLHAVAQIRDLPWRLSVVGGGPQELAYRSLASRLQLEDRVHWMGRLPNSSVHALMEQADLFILPSRFDGWGAVVNEALSTGTPVVVSDACGSSDLVKSDEAGKIVTANSAGSLAAALADMVGVGPRTADRRRSLRAWAEKAISPQVGAAYLMNILLHVAGAGPRPAPPWQ